MVISMLLMHVTIKIVTSCSNLVNLNLGQYTPQCSLVGLNYKRCYRFDEILEWFEENNPFVISDSGFVGLHLVLLQPTVIRTIVK